MRPVSGIMPSVHSVLRYTPQNVSTLRFEVIWRFLSLKFLPFVCKKNYLFFFRSPVVAFSETTPYFPMYALTSPPISISILWTASMNLASQALRLFLFSALPFTVGSQITSFLVHLSDSRLPRKRKSSSMDSSPLRSHERPTSGSVLLISDLFTSFPTMVTRVSLLSSMA